jgi:hypothetical protein
MFCCPAARLFSFLLLGIACVGAYTLSGVANETELTVAQESKLLRHVVLFQFKESSSAEEIAKVVDAFRALPKKIPAIADFEYGTDNSPEKLSEGLTHCFLVTFKSEADREAYLPHPAHMEFVEVLKPHLERVVVVDYWASK